jgi:hypothetical protein
VFTLRLQECSALGWLSFRCNEIPVEGGTGTGIGNDIGSGIVAAGPIMHGPSRWPCNPLVTSPLAGGANGTTPSGRPLH